MVRRHNNRLPENLPQLQNLIKRDPQSYREEFTQQYQHFQNTIAVFQLTPEEPNKALGDLVMFLAQVSHCYPEDLHTFPQELIDLLEKHHHVLNNDIQITICRALVLLRNKSLLGPTDLMDILMKLLSTRDNNLCTFIKSHIITDTKNMNAKHKDVKQNTVLQNRMFSALDNSARIAKFSVEIMVELYKKNVWNDARTVNAIARGCFSKYAKVMVAAIHFFLGKMHEANASDDSDSENEVDLKGAILSNKVNKKSKKREKHLKKVKKQASEQAIKRNKTRSVYDFNIAALNMIHDPQGMAEKLFHQLETTTKQFEMKVIILDLISKLIGTHELIMLNFYPYVQKYMNPHQREITRILQFAAQASHTFVPPDVMESLLKTVANAFITERNTSDAMAIGMNAICEICSRCPLAMTQDLLQDLAAYKTYKSRPVMMAARTLINLFRHIRPELLHKKDRGRPTEAQGELEPMEYAQLNSQEYIPGAEVLLQEATEQSSDEYSDSEDEPSETTIDPETTEKKKEMITQVMMGRMLTDEEFQRIEVANANKKVTPLKRGSKRKMETVNTEQTPGFVRLEDIENIYKKRKHDKEARVQSVRAGQEGRTKFGYKDGRQGQKTNREKMKSKNFQMIKHKLQHKVKRSFKDKQIALRNHLIKLKKMS